MHMWFISRSNNVSGAKSILHLAFKMGHSMYAGNVNYIQMPPQNYWMRGYAEATEEVVEWQDYLTK